MGNRKENDNANRDGNRNPNRSGKKRKKMSKRKKRRIILRRVWVATIAIVLICFLIVVGKRMLVKMAASFIYDSVTNETVGTDETEELSLSSIGGIYATRDEDTSMNFLIIGIEEIEGAKNTDSMMLASVDTESDEIKLVSLMRDSLVEIPGYGTGKLNSAYAKGGMELLINTIELNYMAAIDGYAWVNFENFENVVDELGGVDIELTAEEAEYLNTTNYVSNYDYHNLVEGVNTMNGNQVVGYCRVRYVKTIEGEQNDYGRTLRQRRVLNALFDQYKSTNLLDLVNVTKSCLSYVNTNLDEKTIEKLIEQVIDNGITTMETFRLPVDGAYEAPEEYDGVTYPLVYDWQANITELYKFLYNDTDEEALINYNQVSAEE